MIFHSEELDEKEASVLAEVDRLRNELGYLHRTPQRWYGLLRRNTFAKAIQGSNSIEGYAITTDDAVAAVQGEEPSIDPKTETWQAILGYQEAMTYVLQKVEDRYFTFSTEILKSLHYMMVKHDLAKNPGRWRPGSIYVRREPTGEIVYEGPDSQQIPSLIDELIESLNVKDSQEHVIVRAAIAHLNLVMIHPFSDGNGRMGRCLQSLVLAKDGVAGPLFSSIEEYLGRNTQDYYSILGEVGAGSWHPERNTRPWLRFCLTAHYRQAMTLLRRTRMMQKTWDEVEERVKRLLLPERCIAAVADAALGYRVTNPTYRRSADVTEVVARNDLRELSQRGLLDPKGEKRGRFYIASAGVKEIAVRVTENKKIPDPFAEDSISDLTQAKLFPT
ncbi:MAG TPA: Fic family protein [Nitrospirota bacterium]|nr:Fic family protein [Nitrospirota bacterium]